jgi:hypothetical protein
MQTKKLVRFETAMALPHHICFFCRLTGQVISRALNHLLRKESDQVGKYAVAPASGRCVGLGRRTYRQCLPDCCFCDEGGMRAVGRWRNNSPNVPIAAGRCIDKSGSRDGAILSENPPEVNVATCSVLEDQPGIA